MIKLLFLTDTHIRANSPASRLDDFPKTILKKLEWVGKKANELEVDAIIHGGDWLDRPDAVYSILNDFVKTIVDWGKPIYTVAGNHDIYGLNPETFNRTALGLLVNAKIITRLSSEPIVLKDTVSLTGVDSHYNLDKDDRVDDYVDVKGNDNHTKIHVVHGFLAKAKWDMVPSTAIKDILDTKADIVLTGHEHTGYGVVKKGLKTFCNPGALARVTAGVGDVNQEVKVALITIGKEGKLIELIKLPEDIAKPSGEVLNRDKLLEEKEHKIRLETFTSNLNNFNLSESLSIYTVLDEIAKEEKVDEKVIKLVRERLEKAQEEMKKGEM